VYCWKTTFSLGGYEREFLRKHAVDRIYLRLFDVVLDRDSRKAVPNASVRFQSPLPEGVEAVPTVFITQEALREMAADPEGMAGRMTGRILAMVRGGGLDPVREVQLDCDWTSRTERDYFRLCRAVCDRLHPKGIAVSATIRLHQLGSAPPPVDAGVLMLYNTGVFKDAETRNSILDTATVKTYMKSSYGIPLDLALPVYGWGVWFRRGKFMTLLHESAFEDATLYRDNGDGTFTVRKAHPLDGRSLHDGDRIRLEIADFPTVAAAARMAPAHHSTLLYHLDSLGLSHYTDEEIESLYKNPSDE